MLINSNNVFEILSKYKSLKKEIPELNLIFQKWYFAIIRNKHSIIQSITLEALKLIKINSNILEAHLKEPVEIVIPDYAQTRHCLLDEITEIYNNFCISRDAENTYLTTWR